MRIFNHILPLVQTIGLLWYIYCDSNNFCSSKAKKSKKYDLVAWNEPSCDRIIYEPPRFESPKRHVLNILCKTWVEYKIKLNYVRSSLSRVCKRSRMNLPQITRRHSSTLYLSKKQIHVNSPHSTVIRTEMSALYVPIINVIYLLKYSNYIFRNILHTLAYILYTFAHCNQVVDRASGWCVESSLKPYV